MTKFCASVIFTFLYLIFFSILITLSNYSLKAACYTADDRGNNYNVTVFANPAGSIGNYSHNKVSQRAPWVDSGVYTDGDPDGFIFEIQNKWTPWYGNGISDSSGIEMKANESIKCILKTVNQDSENMGIKGEFDYVPSSITVTENVDGYNQTPLPAEIQAPCWLISGTGLYIGFFGKNGFQLPEVATHLKTANVMCDPPYNQDKNGDGIFTSEECYDPADITKKTKLYYIPYASEMLKGEVQCKQEHFHGTNINKIGVMDCYQETVGSTGKKIKVDKTIFLFKAYYLYNKKDRTKVRKGERVKFIIYDSFYKDNTGQYDIIIRSGVSDMRDQGLIEMILRDMEMVFIGERNEDGVTKGGILKQFYGYIVKDNMFTQFVRLSIIFYIMFLGLQFAMGSLEYTTKELMKILLRLTFVLGFTSMTSWETYDHFVLRFFLDGFSDLIVIFSNITNRMFDPEAEQLPLGGSMSTKFAFIDRACLYLFSDSVARKIQGLFFGVWFGFILIPVFYGLACYYAFQLINAIFPYILMFVQAILALAIGPIFISFYLFKTTEHLFKNWLAFVGARFINMAFLFLFLFAFDAIIKNKFMNLLSFEVCESPLLQAMSGDPEEKASKNSALSFFSFGIDVWDANWSESYPKPNFLGFCIELTFIGILIYLFGVIMKKVPNIVDSMVSIDGESGGGLNSSGESKFGAGLETLTGALDSSIKITGPDGKEVGIASGINNYIKDITKKGFTALGKKIWKDTGGAAINAIKAKECSDNAKCSVLDAGLKGKEAVDKATQNFKQSLASKGISGNELQTKTDAFKKSAEKDFIKTPINNEMKRIATDLAELSKKPGCQLSADTIEKLAKERMEQFVQKELGGTAKDYGKYYENSGFMKGLKFSGDENAKDLNSIEYERMKREFNLQEANSRLGLTGSNLSDYQKAVRNKLNSKKFDDATMKKNAKKYMGKNDIGPDDLDFSNKKFKETLDKEQKELLEKNLESMRKEASLLKAQEMDLTKEKAGLLNQLQNERNKQERENIDKELQRLKSDKNAIEQIANLNRRKRESEEIDLLRSEKGKAIKDGNEEKERELAKQLQELKKNRIGYDELLEKSKLLNGDTNLKDISLITAQEELKRISDKEKELADNMKKLMEEANAAKNLIKDQNGVYEISAQGNANLVMGGINSETFGVQGIKGLGLGEDNKDLIGFGKGAGAAILGADFQGAADDKSTVDQNNNNMLRTRLRLAKQESKYIEFKLAQAKTEGNEKNIQSLEEELKETKKQIRIISDDVEN